MMDIEKELQEIFDDPQFSDVKPTEIKPTSNDRLVLSFEEINTFYELHRRLPGETKGRKEKLLFSRLQGFLSDTGKLNHLLPYDRFELLRPKEPVTENDIEAFFDDPLLDLKDDESDILTVPNHLKKVPKIDTTDYIAQRRKCDDFYLYKDGFYPGACRIKFRKTKLCKVYIQSTGKCGQLFLFWMGCWSIWPKYLTITAIVKGDLPGVVSVSLRMALCLM